MVSSSRKKGHDDRKKRGLLRLFILRTLTAEPKSGYDILKEIESKTTGEWRPSKGTVYPILSDLEEKGLIHGEEEGARARKAYMTTEKGKAALDEAIEKQRSEHRKRTAGRRLLFEETFFDETERELVRLGHRLVGTAMSCDDKDSAIQILGQALEDLEESEEDSD
jgi:DNA-binding PadR family transcriptional regulator